MQQPRKKLFKPGAGLTTVALVHSLDSKISTYGLACIFQLSFQNKNNLKDRKARLIGSLYRDKSTLWQGFYAKTVCAFMNMTQESI